MSKTTAKIIQISDLIQWAEKGELSLSPKYQRNSVWNDTAKSYLMDTIIREMPIPPIFIRQSVDVTTRKTYREIIDGQQRTRAILDYIVNEDFSIKRSHNKEYGGRKYSDLDDDTKEKILQYEIIADVVTEKDDTVIYDMFSRLNSNNIVLNRQEIRNSKFWGEFKVLVYRLSKKFRNFFSNYRIFNDTDFSRMKEAEFISSLVTVMTEGIKADETPKYMDEIYAKYDANFPNADEIETKIDSIFEYIDSVFTYMNGNIGCFSNKNYFFTLFVAIANIQYCVSGLSTITSELSDGKLQDNIAQFIIEYNRVTNDKEDVYGLKSEFDLFIKYHKSHTTSKKERIDRIEFLTKRLVQL